MKKCEFKDGCMIIKSETGLVNNLFSGSKVGSVKFMPGVKQIPYALFANSDISKVEFNDDLQIIGDRAFNKNIFLRYVVIPESVVKIGKNAFTRCPFLEIIACSKKMYEQRESWLGNNPGTVSIIVYDSEHNTADEVYLTKFNNGLDPEGKRQHKIFFEVVKKILNSMGITSQITKTTEYDFDRAKDDNVEDSVSREELERIKNELVKQIYNEEENVLAMGK